MAWYHASRRQLPFREDPTPYHVWVSEAMLQQTQVATALPYYRRFVAELPDIAALAACDEDRLHKLWEGLGYYSRVRNLQKAARVVVQQHGGQLPADYKALLALPGIGPYTAGAIASIAFGLPEVAVDGNVLRVASRLLASHGDITLPAVKQALTEEIRRQQPPTAPGDFNQALMELGALVCTPAAPACESCPLADICRGKAAGVAAALPVKAAAKPKQEMDICVLAVHAGGQVLLHKRPPGGLLAGLWEPLLFEGAYTGQQAQEKLAALLPGAVLQGPLPAARHIFTHRVWRMYGWVCTAPPGTPLPGPGYVWAGRRQLRETHALPGAFKAYLPALLAAGAGPDRV